MRPKQSSLKTADTSNFDINLSRSSAPDSSFFALRLVGRPGPGSRYSLRMFRAGTSGSSNRRSIPGAAITAK